MSWQPLILAKRFEGELWVRASDVAEIVEFLEAQTEAAQPDPIQRGNEDLVQVEGVCSSCDGVGWLGPVAGGPRKCLRCNGTGLSYA